MSSHLRSKLNRAKSFRKPGIVLGLVSLAALLAISVFAESWENKDWTQWSSQDCYHILNVSPWYVMYPEMDGSAQIVSALVIRQALVRQAQLEQHYDKMKSAQKQQFDQMADTCLNLKLDDRIIVRGSDAYPIVGMGQFEVALSASSMKVPPLLPPQRNAISPCPFPLNSPHMPDPGPDLVFPRVVDGKPVIGPGNKDVEVDTPWGVAFHFNFEKMIYKGKPDY